jgi:hypothetical protein
MSARMPRRSFATPFIITLAACGGSQSPTPIPGPTPPPTGNPPAPVDAQSVEPSPEPIHWNPPPPQADSRPPPTTTANPPPPGQNHSPGQQWTVTKHDDKCVALTGSPQRSMNYACPAGISLDKPITVMASGDHCIVLRASPPCPPKAMCNPPPPHEVPCPE